MKACNWRLTVILLIARHVSDVYSTNDISATNWSPNRQKNQGRTSDSAVSSLSKEETSVNDRQHESAKKLIIMHNVAAVVSSENIQPKPSSSLRGMLSEEDTIENEEEVNADELVIEAYKTDSPTRSPWVGIQAITSPSTSTHTDSSTLGRPVSASPIVFSTMALVPTWISNVSRFLSAPTDAQLVSNSSTISPTHQTEAMALNNFAVSIKAIVDDALYETTALHVFRVDIRKATQVYLMETLPYGNLLEIQLFSLERRSRNLLDIEETFRFGGEAVFQGGVPDRSELLEAQELALNDTEAFQIYIHNADASLNDVELIEAAISRDEELVTDISERRTVSLIAVIVVASGVSLVFLFLQITMICKLSRRQRSPPPTSTSIITPKSPR